MQALPHVYTGPMLTYLILFAFLSTSSTQRIFREVCWTLMPSHSIPFFEATSEPGDLSRSEEPAVPGQLGRQSGGGSAQVKAGGEKNSCPFA
jgi:hypothetical protein